MMQDDTTIVAIATPPGRGGIGVVRLSGPGAASIAAKLFPDSAAFEPRVACYRILRDADGARIDDALLTYFPAPRSYTGEDVVEIATHGSPVVLLWLLREAMKHGASQARPGEFTERAFLSGRMDLVEAEAVRDLIDAQTLEQARQAAAQMGGSVAVAVRPIKDRLVELIAALEAGIDFAEDDIDTMPAAQIESAIDAMLPPVESLLGSFAHGRLLREGLRLAIAGRPNAGKSSLFNRLVERDRAIVTATPGTTRDVIAEHISLDGIPVELLDTAGLREAEDEAERLGVARSREAMAEADAVLLVLDASQPPVTDEDSTLLRGRPTLVVRNKVDLLQAAGREQHGAPGGEFRVSAKTGEGVAALRQAILALAGGNAATGSGATLTSMRQHQAVARARDALVSAQGASDSGIPHEMLLLDLYAALRALDELTGQTTADDILHRIFSTFCIGK